MKQILKDKLPYIIAFIIAYYLIEITTFIWVDFSFLPKDFLIDLMLVFSIVAGSLLFESKKATMLYFSFFFTIMLLLFFVNATMYKVYLDLFTIQQLQLLGEATEVVNFEHISVWGIVIGILYAIVYVIVMRLIHKHTKTQELSTKLYYQKMFPMFLTSIIIVFSFFMINTESIDGFVEDKNVASFKRSSLEQYGLIGFYTKEISNMLEKTDPIAIPDSEIDYADPTEYFGFLEGKNVITILLESVQPFAINETLTPNMYQLAEDGLYFEYSYSENKTNYSELIGIVGNYPMTPVGFKSSDYDFSYGMPQVLNALGYQTSYFHENVPTFYARGSLMVNLGFENQYFHDDLFPGEPIWNWNGDYTLDSLTMEKMLPNFTTTEEPFYTFWATMSTHGPYNYGTKNIALFNEKGYFAQIDRAAADGKWTNILAEGEAADQMRIRHYQAAVMDLDVAIGMMMDDLEQKGILEDTVVVLYGDHNVYYHEITKKRFAENNDFTNMDMYENFFCIYNPSLTERYLELSGDTDSTIDKFASTYNIVPTLYDLLGITYDEDMFFGHSIFSDKKDVFYSIKLTGFFDDNFYSSNGIDIDYFKEGIENYTVEEIQAFLDNCQLIKYKMERVNNRYIYSREKRK